MIGVFTICSNNYLAQAKTLGDSIRNVNPDYSFSIVLVDKLSPDVDYENFKPYELIQIEQICIDGLQGMIYRYNITEFNTAVKPFIFDYLFRTQVNLKGILYFDPDIYVYKSLASLCLNFDHSDFILTPHFMTPIYDNKRPSEQDILNSGIFNLGFIGIRRSSQHQHFLNWWMTKLKDLCYVRVKDGLFVDQLWINFLPVYYERVYIERDFGYNVAYWNLHERSVENIGGNNFIVNGKNPLFFFHFSGYKIGAPDNISRYQNRFTFLQRPDIIPLFQKYRDLVLQNKHDSYVKIKWHYDLLKEAKRPKGRKKFVYRVKRYIYKVLKNFELIREKE